MSAHPSPGFGASRADRPDAPEWIYRLLLRIYPPAFRMEYGSEMTQLFRDQWRDNGGSSVRFWTSVLLDAGRSAPALRVDAWCARWWHPTHVLGGTMKLVAVAVALFGMFGAVSGVAEGLAGGRQGMLGSTYLLSVVLSVTAGGLLIAAGVTALRATPSGNRAASRAATASLVVFVLARIVFGWMSLFIQLMGILLPLAILVVLHRSPGRRSVV